MHRFWRKLHIIWSRNDIKCYCKSSTASLYKNPWFKLSVQQMWLWRQLNIYLPLLNYFDFFYKSHTSQWNMNWCPSIKSTFIGIWRRTNWWMGVTFFYQRRQLTSEMEHTKCSTQRLNYAHSRRPAMKLVSLHVIIQITCQTSGEITCTS
jgi:hypothetical protein